MSDITGFTPAAATSETHRRSFDRRPSRRRPAIFSLYVAILNGLWRALGFSPGSRTLALLLIEMAPSGGAVRTTDDELRDFYGECRGVSRSGTRKQMGRYRRALTLDQLASGSTVIIVESGEYIEHPDGSVTNKPSTYDLTNLFELFALMIANLPRPLPTDPRARARLIDATLERLLPGLPWAAPLKGRGGHHPTEEEIQKRKETAFRNAVLAKYKDAPGSPDDRLSEVLEAVLGILRPDGPLTDPPDSDVSPVCLKGDTYLPFEIEGGGTNCPASKNYLTENTSTYEFDKHTLMQAPPPGVSSPDAGQPGVGTPGGGLAAFRSVGCEVFDLTTKDDRGGAVDYLEGVSADQFGRGEAALLRRTAGGHLSLIARPRGESFVQLDDLPDLDRLRPFAFLGVETSPGSYQAWLKVRDLTPDLRRRLVEGCGADKSASGALRWPGSRNFKHDPAPEVKVVFTSPGREVTVDELEAAGLLAPDLSNMLDNPQCVKFCTSKPVPRWDGFRAPRPARLIPCGERHNAAVRFACGLRGKGWEEGGILDALRRSAHLYAEPLPDRELQSIARSVARYRAGGATVAQERPVTFRR
jgi:hypothetical protein